MPARLACVKPAASVRSEPGSNSQVGLETLSRLITTFDEVPPYISPTIHIADDDGVTFSKRVPPKSFVQPRKMKTEGFKYSRLARTSPSTFLFLHLHLSNSPGPEHPSPIAGSTAKSSIRRQITTDTYRLLIHSS